MNCWQRGDEIGKELGELRQRIQRLEQKTSCKCKGSKPASASRKMPSKITPEYQQKVQEFIKAADGYRRMAEGEDVPGLSVPESLDYTPAQLACIIGLVVAMCGVCIVVCGGPEDLPCIAECCGDVWEEIIETCVG